MAEDKSIENEVLKLEKKYWKAIKDIDVEAAVSLSADPCLVTGPQGVMVLARDNFREMMSRPTCYIKEYDLKDPKVHVLNDSCAVIAYQVQGTMTVDDEEIKMDAADSSTWIKKDGKWLCALHTESMSGDPYGRDRQY